MDTGIETPTALPTDAEAPESKTKVFISYSRQDSEFVGRLVEALQGQDDFHIFQDTSDILPAEEWWARLVGLIGEADTIVFCMSSNSLASKVCADEVDLAEKLNKRIIPVVLEQPDGDVPKGLSKINYIFFDNPDAFDQSFSHLLTALRSDIGWIREHTRIGELARGWDATGKRRDRLLSGLDLHDAERWVGFKPAVAPELTDNMLAFIKASRTEETAKRWRTRRNLVTVAALFIGGGAAWATQDAWLPVVHVAAYRAQNLAKDLSKPGEVFKDCSFCPEMVVVPAGSFMMGSPESEKGRNKTEGPQRKVTIAKAFAVGKFEVTFAQWEACRSSGECKHGPGDQNWGRGNRPVISVSWDDAQQYVKWMSNLTGQSYRLLTEAEWEYAARAGTTTTYSWGNDVGRNNANCGGCGSQWDIKQTAPVGSFKPNAFGLYEMHGNVLEWVQDCHGDYKDAPTDGTAVPDTPRCARVLRGGSWSYNPRLMRAAVRYGVGRDIQFSDYGFRVARVLSAARTP